MWAVDKKHGLKCIKPEASLWKVLPIILCNFFSDLVMFLAFISSLTIVLCYDFFSHSKELFTFVPNVVLLSLYYSRMYIKAVRTHPLTIHKNKLKMA